LDGDAFCLVVKERELREALGRLNRPPALVVTDSQAFLKVSADTPPDVKMTSFSILFERQKGDLRQFVEGAMSIERLRPGDRVLVAEACSHHPIGDDIGRVKIPRWLKQYVGGDLRIDTLAGRDFPDDPLRCDVAQSRADGPGIHGAHPRRRHPLDAVTPPARAIAPSNAGSPLAGIPQSAAPETSAGRSAFPPRTAAPNQLLHL